MDPRRPAAPWRVKLQQVIFEAETPAGRAFDVALIAAILLSIAAVMLESVAAVRARHGALLLRVEWAFTLLFTVEYLLRLACVGRPLRYARSFFGLVDLLAILPTWLGLVLPGAQALLTIRALRLLRVFRVFKLGAYVGEAAQIARALRASRRKIGVFLFTVLTVVVILGTLLYVIEGPEHGFADIPTAVYWAIVTLTTVGYGDISPATPFGKALAALVMILGYGIIAVPTGIVTVEMGRAGRAAVSTHACPSCTAEGHDPDAVHCKFCGARR